MLPFLTARINHKKKLQFSSPFRRWLNHPFFHAISSWRNKFLSIFIKKVIQKDNLTCKKLVPVGKDSPVENLCFFYCSFFHTPLLFKIRTEFYRIVLRYIQLTTPRFFSHFHFYIILKCFFFSYYYSTPYFFILGFIFAFPFFSRIIIIFFWFF